jgi:peptide/nickel transport system ATP-binding protein
LGEEEWRHVRGREIAMIFQEPMTSLNPVMRICAQIDEAILAHESKIAGHLLHRRTRELLAAVPEIPRSGEV